MGGRDMDFPPGSAGYMFIIPMQTGAYSIEHL